MLTDGMKNETSTLGLPGLLQCHIVVPVSRADIEILNLVVAISCFALISGASVQMAICTALHHKAKTRPRSVNPDPAGIVDQTPWICWDSSDREFVPAHPLLRVRLLPPGIEPRSNPFQPRPIDRGRKHRLPTRGINPERLLSQQQRTSPSLPPIPSLAAARRRRRRRREHLEETALAR
jgi:hypothetical protein